MESVYIILFRKILSGKVVFWSTRWALSRIKQFNEVPLLYEPKKYKQYLSGNCHINSFNENIVLSQ